MDAEYLLRRILAVEGALILGYPWGSEGDRWKELVFALLTRVVSEPEWKVRDIVNGLYALGLLDIGMLAKSKKHKVNGRSPDMGGHILEFLDESGVDAEQSEKSLRVIEEAACGLAKHFGGKIQLYLRGYGSAMLHDVKGLFDFSVLDTSQVQFAFTYWLQNVLNMPLSLIDENVDSFCKHNGLTTEALVAAADSLDVNLALLDDIILAYVSKRAGIDLSDVSPSTAAGVGASADIHDSVVSTLKTSPRRKK
jgi:hypothetical protein